MKVYYKFFLIILFYFPLNAHSNENISIVDVDKLFSDSDKGKIIISQLNELKKNNEIEIKKKEEIIIKLDQDIKSKKNLINEDELNTMISEMNNLLKDIKNYKDNFFKDYEKIKNEQLTVFFNDISPIIEQYMIKNSIEIIIDKKNIFIANQNNEITNDLLKIINKEIK